MVSSVIEPILSDVMVCTLLSFLGDYQKPESGVVETRRLFFYQYVMGAEHPLALRH
jgi:hypothetical protein